MKRAILGVLRGIASGAKKLVTLPASAISSARNRSMGAKSDAKSTWAVIGLGNPGHKFDGTRHNVGFDVIDAIATIEGIAVTSAKCRALVGVGKVGQCTVVLAKPQTYMNLSGKSVRDIMKTFKIPRDRLLIVYDDLDTPLAELRMKMSGSHGGHNGVRSIIDDATKGMKDFARVKVGIGRPKDSTTPVYEYVLSKFNDEDAAKMIEAVNEAKKSVTEVLMENNLSDAMTRCNSKFAPKKVKAPKKPKIPKESVIVTAQNDGNDQVKVTLEVRAEHNNSKKSVPER